MRRTASSMMPRTRSLNRFFESLAQGSIVSTTSCSSSFSSASGITFTHVRMNPKHALISSRFLSSSTPYTTCM